MVTTKLTGIGMHRVGTRLVCGGLSHITSLDYTEGRDLSFDEWDFGPDFVKMHGIARGTRHRAPSCNLAFQMWPHLFGMFWRPGVIHDYPTQAEHADRAEQISKTNRQDSNDECEIPNSSKWNLQTGCHDKVVN